MEEAEFNQLVVSLGTEYWKNILVFGRYSVSIDLDDAYARKAEQEDYEYFQKMNPGLWEAIWDYLGQKLINV